MSDVYVPIALASALALSAPADLVIVTASSRSRLSYISTLLRKSRIEFGWDWSNRAWGYCREFEELGMTSLVLGALHIQFDWDV